MFGPTVLKQFEGSPSVILPALGAEEGRSLIHPFQEEVLGPRQVANRRTEELEVAACRPQATRDIGRRKTLGSPSS